MRGIMSVSRHSAGRRAGESQAGFTLVEALIAMVILSFGLVAVTNLMMTATLSNSRASSNTVAASVASQYMEQLKSMPVTGQPYSLNTLCSSPPCGDLDANDPGFFAEDTIDGVGQVVTRWTIDLQAAVLTTYMITVRSEVQRPVAGAAARAEFTSVRVVTNGTTP